MGSRNWLRLHWISSLQNTELRTCKTGMQAYQSVHATRAWKAMCHPWRISGRLSSPALPPLILPTYHTLRSSDFGCPQINKKVDFPDLLSPSLVRRVFERSLYIPRARGQGVHNFASGKCTYNVTEHREASTPLTEIHILRP